MRLTQVTPFVPCRSLVRQIGFYRDILGFKVGYEDEAYAFIYRDDIALRLVQVDAQVDLTDPARQGSFYIDVEGIDALYAALKPALDTLPPERVRVPFDQPYGQRELQVFDEDCTLVFFGEAIEQP